MSHKRKFKLWLRKMLWFKENEILLRRRIKIFSRKRLFIQRRTALRMF